MSQVKSYEYIVLIAEKLSFSAAAEQLGIAQSALSRYILNIEKKLGVELFDRSTIPLQLTEAGRCFVEIGRKVLDLNRQLEKKLEDIRCNRNREIRIGTGPSRAPAILPLFLKHFLEIHPDVRVITEECRSVELAERLSEGKVDLVISMLDYSTEKFGMEELFEEKVIMAVHKKYVPEVEQGLNQRGYIVIENLRVPVISLHPKQQLRNALDILSRGKIFPQYISEYVESAMALVRNGFGVAMVPSYCKQVEKNTSEIKYYPIEIPDDLTADERNKLLSIMKRKVGIFYRKEQFLSEIEREFINCVKEVCRVFGTETSV